MDQDLSSFRPSRLWRRMPLDQRLEAAGLFWADEHSADQQLEAVASLATHMKFRTRSVVGLPADKKAKYLATLPNVSDSIVPAPDPDKLRTGAAALATKFPPEDVSLYLATLVSQDPDTWGGLADLPESQPQGVGN
jgi:hypothetical protein